MFNIKHSYEIRMTWTKLITKSRPAADTLMTMTIRVVRNGTVITFENKAVLGV